MNAKTEFPTEMYVATNVRKKVAHVNDSCVSVKSANAWWRSYEYLRRDGRFTVCEKCGGDLAGRPVE